MGYGPAGDVQLQDTPKSWIYIQYISLNVLQNRSKPLGKAYAPRPIANRGEAKTQPPTTTTVSPTPTTPIKTPQTTQKQKKKKKT